MRELCTADKKSAAIERDRGSDPGLSYAIYVRISTLSRREGNTVRKSACFVLKVI